MCRWIKFGLKLDEYDVIVNKNVAEAKVRKKKIFDEHNWVKNKFEVGDTVRIRKGSHDKTN